MMYNVEMIFRTPQGKLQEKRRYKNLVVSVGREQVARMLATGISNKIAEIAWGDGGHVVSNPSDFVPATLGDTALNNELLRKNIAFFTFPSISEVRFVGILEPNELIGVGISEQVLIHADGTIFARLAYPLIFKGEVQIEFRWTIQI